MGKWAYLSMNVFKGKKDPEQIRNKIKYLKTMGNFMDQTAEPIIGPSSAGETPPPKKSALKSTRPWRTSLKRRSL
ncbi:hypothetical protein AAMO2058_000106800 [Amorphochlora amoebiformis]